MPRAILAVIAIAILASTAVYGLQAGLETAGEDHTNTNETWTPDAGNVTTLDDSNRTGAYYDKNVTVYDENDTLMDPGTDYEWYPGNGTIKTLTSGGLDNDSDALITYQYQQTTREQRQFARVLSHIPQLMGLALPLGALLVFLLFIRGA